MRPYLALIKDSFRAAIASRVLYVLLAVITLLLLALAPLHVIEILDWKIDFGTNVNKPDQLALRLVERGKDPKYPAVIRIWERLEEKTREKVRTWAEFMEDESTMPDAQQRTLHQMGAESQLEKGLNTIIKDRSFYKQEAWAKKRLNTETKELIEEGVENLSDERLRRLNRLLMASAVGGLIKRGSDKALELKYAIWGWDLTFNLSHKQFSQTTTSVVTYIFDWVLWIGLFVAILVTANIIPETFLPGSLNLLLSKPISRWGLLIAKFIGGCTYVSLCAVYLFVGIWLWMGLALGVWEPRILWAVPLYIIVFAIYYSVSTLVGVWSRSQILAIVMTMLFWAFCFAVGSSYNLVTNILSHARPSDLVVVKDTVVQVGKMNAVFSWDEANSKWQEELTIKMMDPQRVGVNIATAFENADVGGDGDLDRLGPVYDPNNDKLVAGMPDLADMGSLNYQDLYESNADNIEFRQNGKLPRGALKLIPDIDGVIVVESTGKFWRYAPETADEDKQKEKTADNPDSKDRSKSKRFKNEFFVDISPEERINNLARKRVSYNVATRSIVVETSKTLTAFRLGDDGKYFKDVEKDVEDLIAAGVHVMLVSGGQTVAMVLGNGQIHTFDETTLEHKQTYLPQTNSQFKSASASNDGRFFVLTGYDKTAWLLDVQKPDSIDEIEVPEQGSITAIRFDDQNRIWVGDQMNSVRLYELGSSKRIKSYSPKTGRLAKFYHLGLKPLYWICPKPGEFYKVVAYVSGTNSVDEDMLDTNLRRNYKNEDPWQPLWSGLLFMCAILFIAGLVFAFRDF